MTGCDEVRARLDDYVDGEVDAALAAILEEHLGTCLGCRRELQELRDLVTKAKALPGSIEPDVDLWPGIEAQINEQTVVHGRFGGWPRVARWTTLAAGLAAVVVLATATVLTQRSPMAGPAIPVAASGAARNAAVPARNDSREVDAALAAYSQAADALRQAIKRRERVLPATTRRTVEENLQVIDEAISRLRVALAANPENHELEVLLVATYQQQIELLQRVTEIPAQG